MAGCAAACAVWSAAVDTRTRLKVAAAPVTRPEYGKKRRLLIFRV